MVPQGEQTMYSHLQLFTYLQFGLLCSVRLGRWELHCPDWSDSRIEA